MMPARVLTISVDQPNASLIAAGAQTILTESWWSFYSGRLLIRASDTPPWLDALATGAVVLAAGGAVVELDGEPVFMDDEHEGEWLPLPRGCVVASCELAAVVPIVDTTRADQDDIVKPCVAWDSDAGIYLFRTIGSENELIEDQARFGSLVPGRNAWLLADVKANWDRCPRCWGEGTVRLEGSTLADDTTVTCPTCAGAGACAPVPMVGREGLFAPVWEPAR